MDQAEELEDGALVQGVEDGVLVEALAHSRAKLHRCACRLSTSDQLHLGCIMEPGMRRTRGTPYWSGPHGR